MTDLTSARAPRPTTVQGDVDVTVRDFLTAWDAGDVEAAQSFFADGAMRYEGTNRSGGRGQGVTDYLAWAAKTADELRSEVHQVVVVGGVVVTERTDHWTIGGRELSVPTVGTFDLENGRITTWSDTTSHDLTQPVADVPAVDTTLPVVPAREASDDTPRSEALASPEPAGAELPPVSFAAPAAAAAALPATSSQADLARIDELERQLHEWRTRATIWRERALAAKSFGEALQANVDDLRRLVIELDERARAVDVAPAPQLAEPVLEAEPVADAPPVAEAAPVVEPVAQQAAPDVVDAPLASDVLAPALVAAEAADESAAPAEPAGAETLPAVPETPHAPKVIWRAPTGTNGVAIDPIPPVAAPEAAVLGLTAPSVSTDEASPETPVLGTNGFEAPARAANGFSASGPETVTQEAPKEPAASAEAPKVSSPKVETPKVETPKVETPKVETPKVEDSKVDAPKVETPKVDTPKVDTPKVDTPTPGTTAPAPARAPGATQPYPRVERVPQVALSVPRSIPSSSRPARKSKWVQLFEKSLTKTFWKSPNS